MNETLATYVSESIIPAAMTEDVPEVGRYFILKVNRKLKDVTFDETYFAEFKRVIRLANVDNILRKGKREMSEGMRKMSEGMGREFGVDVDLEIGETVGLAPHYEDEDEIAYSMFANHGVAVGRDKKESWILAATTTNLNVSGRLLFLYSYGSEEDLEWTRAVSKDWASRIAGRNGPPRLRPRRGGMIDWSKVFAKGIGGALAGGLLAVLLTLIALFRRWGGNDRK